MQRLSESSAVGWVRALPQDQGLVFVAGVSGVEQWPVGAAVFDRRRWIVTKVTRFAGCHDPRGSHTEGVWCRPASAVEGAHQQAMAKVA